MYVLEKFGCENNKATILVARFKKHAIYHHNCVSSYYKNKLKCVYNNKRKRESSKKSEGSSSNRSKRNDFPVVTLRENKCLFCLETDAEGNLHDGGTQHPTGDKINEGNSCKFKIYGRELLS